MAEKPLLEELTSLEKAVSLAKDKQAKMESLQQQTAFASKEYADAVGKVEELRKSLNDRLGNIFPEQNARVKVS